MESIFIEIGPANFTAAWIVGGVALALTVLFFFMAYALDDDVFLGLSVGVLFIGALATVFVCGGISNADEHNKESHAFAAVDALGVDRLAEEGMIRLKDGSLCYYDWAGVEGGIEVTFVC